MVVQTDCRVVRVNSRLSNRAMRWYETTFGARIADIVQRKILDETGLRPIDDVRPDDVILVAYPKSGITWLQNMVASVVYGVDGRFSPDSLVQELVPAFGDRSYFRRYGSPSFFKSHDLPKPDFRRVVYLLRDGRDVMVSYFHHVAAMTGSSPNFLAIVESGDGIDEAKWHEHVEAWASNPYNASVLTLRYEDLKRQAPEELRRFCDFVGIERDDAFLAGVVERTSFKAMQLKEDRYGWDNPVWPVDKRFVRRGQVGSYLDEMPPEVLESFMRQARGTLEGAGYST